MLPPTFTNSSHYLPQSVRHLRDTAAVITSAHLVVAYLLKSFQYEAQRSFSKGVIYFISTNRSSLSNDFPIYFSFSTLFCEKGMVLHTHYLYCMIQFVHPNFTINWFEVSAHECFIFNQNIWIILWFSYKKSK